MKKPTPDEPDNIDVTNLPVPTWPLVTGLRAIAAGDLDHDVNGDMEIVTASYDDNRIAWHETRLGRETQRAERMAAFAPWPTMSLAL